MNSKHVFLFLLLFFITFPSCRKDRHLPRIEMEHARKGRDTQHRGATAFFDWHFVSNNNPYISSRTNGRDWEPDPVVEAARDLMVDLDSVFVTEELPSLIGYPVWDRSVGIASAAARMLLGVEL